MKELNDILGSAFSEFSDLKTDFNKSINKLPKDKKGQFVEILSEIDKGLKEKDVNLLSKQMDLLTKMQKNG